MIITTTGGLTVKQPTSHNRYHHLSYHYHYGNYRSSAYHYRGYWHPHYTT